MYPGRKGAVLHGPVRRVCAVCCCQPSVLIEPSADGTPSEKVWAGEVRGEAVRKEGSSVCSIVEHQ